MDEDLMEIPAHPGQRLIERVDVHRHRQPRLRAPPADLPRDLPQPEEGPAQTAGGAEAEEGARERGRFHPHGAESVSLRGFRNLAPSCAPAPYPSSAWRCSS